jgi:N-acetylglucosaminyldiphosphoundecaprenol N-acetyl-beta-D-mannosaminyltransferase
MHTRAPETSVASAAHADHLDPGVGRVVIEGIGFDPLTEQGVVKYVMAALHAGRGGMIVTPNVDFLVKARRLRLTRLIDAADVVVADGMPIVWAAALRRQRLQERVTGSSLIWSLSKAAAVDSRSVFLLGAAEGIAPAAAERLRTQLPALRVSGWHCPPVGFEDNLAARAAIDTALAAARPNIVFVALGFPKQELLMAELRRRFPEIWFVGCGGALSMAAGRIPRAPRWMQAAGLEWCNRMTREPKRLARRYIVDDLPFACAMIARSLLASSRR